MAKLTIQEAADHYHVSKEAIHNRIRRGSLATLSEQGVKYVIVDEALPQSKQTKGDDRYYSFLEEQNRTLQEKVERLEKDNSTLRDQKEQMLIEERIKIENIYKEKDEQLKNILQTISAKFLTQNYVSNMDETVQDTVVEVIDVEDESVSLKKYLKFLGLKSKKIEKTMERFKMLAKRDKRVLIKDGKLFIQPKRYSYKDLI
jgi:ribosome-binding factor A